MLRRPLAHYHRVAARDVGSSSSSSSVTSTLFDSSRLISASRDGFARRRMMGAIRFAGFTAAVTVCVFSGMILSWPVLDFYLLPFLYRKAVLYSDAKTNLPIEQTVEHSPEAVAQLRRALFGDNDAALFKRRYDVSAAQVEERERLRRAELDAVGLHSIEGLSHHRGDALLVSQGQSAAVIDPTGGSLSNSKVTKALDLARNKSGQTGNSAVSNDNLDEGKGRLIFMLGSPGSGKSSIVAQMFGEVELELEEAVAEQKLAELHGKKCSGFTRQPIVYINCRGFVDASTFLYTTISNIVSPNLGFVGGLLIAYHKLFHVGVDFFTLNSAPEHMAYLIFALAMNHLRLALEKIKYLRNNRADHAHVRRPVIVIDSFERALDIITLHGKEATLSRFPMLLAQLLLRSALDEGVCDVMIIADPRVLYDGDGTCVKHTKLERAFPDLSVRASFVTLPPRLSDRHRLMSSEDRSIANSSVNRIISLMKQYHARPFLLRYILRELNEKGTCDISSTVKVTYATPDQIRESFQQLVKANIAFPAMGHVLGQTSTTFHPRKFHYVSRRNFLPPALEDVDSMELQFVKPRMGFWNYLLCAALPWYGANLGVHPKTTGLASNTTGGPETKPEDEVRGTTNSMINLNVSVFPGNGPTISEEIMYCDFAFSDCHTVPEMINSIAQVSGYRCWFGLQYLEDGEIWCNMIDQDDFFALRNCDQIRPKPAPTWLRDLVSLVFWGAVGVLWKSHLLL